MNTENNKLIAEFMGRKFQAYYDNISYNKEFNTYSECQAFIDTLSEKGYTPQIGWSLGCGKYDESWDWLHPVFMQCQEIALQHGGKLKQVYDELFHGMIIFNNIQWLYKAVVEFITWYNKQQPKK